MGGSSSYVGLLAWVILSTHVLGTLQQLTIYEKPDLQGDSVTFTKSIPDLTNYEFFLNFEMSYCVKGLWSVFRNRDFEGVHFSFYSPTEVCGYRGFAGFRSIRHTGPPDFNLNTPAISLIEGTNASHLGGLEHLVMGAAETNILFEPKTLISFGNSSWTLFTGNNFDGDSICFQPNYNNGQYAYTGFVELNSTVVVQSLARGCDTFEVENNIKLFKNNLEIQ